MALNEVPNVDFLQLPPASSSSIFTYTHIHIYIYIWVVSKSAPLQGVFQLVPSKAGLSKQAVVWKAARH